VTPENQKSFVSLVATFISKKILEIAREFVEEIGLQDY
jgi:hypothetical protein